MLKRNDKTSIQTHRHVLWPYFYRCNGVAVDVVERTKIPLQTALRFAYPTFAFCSHSIGDRNFSNKQMDAIRYI